MALGIGATARPTPSEGVPVLSASGTAHWRERHHGECANPDRRRALDPGGILVIVLALGLVCPVYRVRRRVWWLPAVWLCVQPAGSPLGQLTGG